MAMYVIRSEEKVDGDTITTLIGYTYGEDKVLKKMIELTNGQKDKESIYLNFVSELNEKIKKSHDKMPSDFEEFRAQKLALMEEEFKKIGESFFEFSYNKTFSYEVVPELTI